MENFRSQSTREGRNGYYHHHQSHGGDDRAAAAPTSMQDLRSYSTNSYASSYVHQPAEKEERMKKSKSRVTASNSKNWGIISDPELQRKKRVVSYKAYTVEGKVKGSFRKSFRWIKDVVHGLW